MDEEDFSYEIETCFEVVRERWFALYLPTSSIQEEVIAIKLMAQ